MARFVYLLDLNANAVRIFQILISNIVLGTVGWLKVDKGRQLLQNIASVCQLPVWSIVYLQWINSTRDTVRFEKSQQETQPAIWVKSRKQQCPFEIRIARICTICTIREVVSLPGTWASVALGWKMNWMALCA